jgi:hypothetical protein
MVFQEANKNYWQWKWILETIAEEYQGKTKSLLLLLPIQGLSPLTRSEAKGIVVSISFLDAQCPVFQQDDKSMFATAGVQ